MLAPFFIVAHLAIAAGILASLFGYDLAEHRFVSSVGEYFLNYLKCVPYVIVGGVVIWGYTRLFGWPEME